MLPENFLRQQPCDQLVTISDRLFLDKLSCSFRYEIIFVPFSGLSA